MALISTKLNTPTHDLIHYQLKLWGHYEEQMVLYSRLVGHLSPKWNGKLMNFMGTVHYSQGNFASAIECCETEPQHCKRIGVIA